MGNYSYTFLLYLCTFIYWGFVLLAWVTNYKLFNREHIKPVHYILTFTLTQKLLTLGLSVLLESQSESSPYTQYLALCLKSFESIFDTFLFSLVMVLGCGVGQTHDSLDEQDMSRVTFMMGVMYIIFNLYYFNKTYFEVPVVLMLMIFWYISRKNFSFNLQIQRNTYMDLRNRRQTPNVRQESDFFRISLIRFFCDILFLSKVSYHVVNGICWWYKLKVSKQGLTILSACEESIILIWMTGICVIFWPRPGIQSILIEDSLLRKNCFYTGTISTKTEELPEDTPAILVFPSYQGLNADRPYDGLSIAIPMNSTRRTPSTDQINEPLLRNFLNES